MQNVDCLLANEWEHYRKMMISGPITNAELILIKYHFYAGSLAIIHAVNGIKNVPKHEGQGIIDSLNREIKLFLKHGHQTA